MWLIFPMTILIHRAVYDPRTAVRAWTWGVLGAAGLLMGLSLPIFPNDLQAYGNNLAATAVISAGLVWHLLHPLTDAKLADAKLPDVELADAVPGALCGASDGLQPDRKA
jgi:hypothetical protein